MIMIFSFMAGCAWFSLIVTNLIAGRRVLESPMARSCSIWMTCLIIALRFEIVRVCGQRSRWRGWRWIVVGATEERGERLNRVSHIADDDVFQVTKLCADKPTHLVSHLVVLLLGETS